MKSFILALALAFAMPVYADATAEPPKTKRVCKDMVKDGKPVKNKDGSVKQECRTIKVHKKHEGTKVPPKWVLPEKYYPWQASALNI